MKLKLSIDEAYARASFGLQQKMQYSIRLLQKAERLALAYDAGGITLHSVEEKTLRLCCILHSWLV